AMLRAFIDSGAKYLTVLSAWLNSYTCMVFPAGMMGCSRMVSSTGLPAASDVAVNVRCHNGVENAMSPLEMTTRAAGMAPQPLTTSHTVHATTAAMPATKNHSAPTPLVDCIPT